jgi:hypothetical protein
MVTLSNTVYWNVSFRRFLQILQTFLRNVCCIYIRRRCGIGFFKMSHPMWQRISLYSKMGCLSACDSKKIVRYYLLKKRLCSQELVKDWPRNNAGWSTADSKGKGASTLVTEHRTEQECVRCSVLYGLPACNWTEQNIVTSRVSRLTVSCTYRQVSSFPSPNPPKCPPLLLY